MEYEIDYDVAKLAEKIVEACKDLSWIKDYDISIGFVRCSTAKQNRANVAADCRKVAGPFKAFCNHDIVITVYSPVFDSYSENQQKVILWHELKHIGWSEDSVKIEDHDVKDFYVILKAMGMDWNRLDEDVPDILNSVIEGSVEDEGY